MAYPVKRRFPRIPFEQVAQIEYLDRAKGARIVCPAKVQTVACEGIGLTPTTAVRLPRKARINVTVAIDGEDLSLPGAVAWSRPTGLGVHLLLELARPETRQRWAHWIVEKTSAHTSRGRSARTSKKFLRS